MLFSESGSVEISLPWDVTHSHGPCREASGEAVTGCHNSPEGKYSREVEKTYCSEVVGGYGDVMPPTRLELGLL